MTFTRVSCTWAENNGVNVSILGTHKSGNGTGRGCTEQCLWVQDNGWWWRAHGAGLFVWKSYWRHKYGDAVLS